MMKDVEEAALVRNRNVSSNKNEESSLSDSLPTPLRKARNPLFIIYRISIIGVCLYFLHTMQVFAKVLWGKDISHGWLKVGLAACVGK